MGARLKTKQTILKYFTERRNFCAELRRKSDATLSKHALKDWICFFLLLWGEFYFISQNKLAGLIFVGTLINKCCLFPCMWKMTPHRVKVRVQDFHLCFHWMFSSFFCSSSSLNTSKKTRSSASRLLISDISLTLYTPASICPRKADLCKYLLTCAGL